MSRRTLLVLASLAITLNACAAKPPAPTRAESGIGEFSARPATPAAWPESYGFGSRPTDASIAMLDTDVDTTGAGLPAGKGTAAQGAPVYAAKCASCHGAKGEGVAPSPMLVQAITPTDSFPWAKKASSPKTVGNYWPFATTLYGYIRHAMPQTAPGSLSPTEVYQLVAYLLAENGVLPRDAVLDARTLPALRLPMRGRLIIDTRRGGAEVR